ncbi:MAG: hypothetical protein CBC01_01530 [Betaproteobacteria bacterium TMED41]|nr:MAG: hypothetical protein CBC01_01530 [Betaproteobacteria bacterium TMED41]
MKKILLFLPLSIFCSQVLSENVFYCSGQATMCVRKINNIWRADVCNSEKFIFTFNDDFSELTYKKRVLVKNGGERKIIETLKCKEVEPVSPARNRELFSASNGRITCIDFDGSQLGVPEILEEVIHFSSNKDRFSIYPMHSHSFLMNGPQADFVTFGTCSNYE